MNWLDFVIVVIAIMAAFMGIKTGIIGAAITTAGGFVGWLVAGQAADNVGGLFDKSIENDTLVTVISYVIIVVAGLLVGGFVSKIVKPVLTVATLGFAGMVDKLGGLGLGFVAGLVVSAALIMSLARFTYSFEIPEEGLAAKATQKVSEQLDMNVVEVRETLEDALAGSALVEVFINIADGIPADTLGFVPSDFKITLDILEEEIDKRDAESS